MSSTRTLILFACAVVVVWPARITLAQSNYASHANSIEYQGEGLPEEATLDGKVTKLDDLSNIIFLNRTRATLNCAAGYMQVDMKFNEPFFGKAYADYDRNSACQTSGKGDLSYRIDLPLKGCGTKQGPQRVFTNNIVVRFHPGLEMDGDEIITIVCRYPPPITSIPPGLPAPIITGPSVVEPPLKGIQILFIICAIMFLTLLLLGLGVSYYCLRRRPIPIVRRVVHVGSGSEITALESGSIDDLFLTTVTERTTIEDVERHKRLVTEYKARPVPPPPADPTWDVTIRNYATDAQRQRQWEDFSDVSSASGAPSVRSVEPPLAASMPVPSSTYLPSAYAADELRSPELVGNMKPVELPPEDRSVSNWDVLIRVLQDVDMPDTSISTAALHTDLHRYPLQRQLSYDDKLKWKEIITTESTLRTMLSEATVREDFERIRSDARYENLFEPRSWDVIIRILAPPLEDVELRQSKRSKKRETWDTRSRRSSLPTLYEYDSDGDSSVRTITQEPQLVAATSQTVYGPAGSLASGSRSRRTSRSSYNSNNIDMRSMSEVIVDFGRMSGGPSGGSGGASEGGSSYIVAHNKAYFDDDDDDEEERYDQRSLQRSLSHPSLARSASEFTERWIIPEDMDPRNRDSDANNGSMYGSGGTLEDTRTTYIKQSRTTVSRERRDNW